MTDFSTARINMIESQIRPNGITDTRVLDAMSAVPRENFVPAASRGLAYMDDDVAVGSSNGMRRVLIEPMSMARLLQLAAIQPGDIILDVGCATGYSSAVLSLLGESVVAIEEDEQLAAQAIETLGDLDYDSTAVLNTAHAQGCPDEAPFDVIFLNGLVHQIPDALLQQLKDGGRLVAVTGSGTPGHATVWTREGDRFSTRVGYDATIAPLSGFQPEPATFTF